jgi:hypothetical protein
MSLPAHPACRRRFPAFFLPALALALGLAGRAALAADLNLEAQLIWGANDRPATVNHKLVDPALAAALRHNFKWTNYYLITNVAAVIPLKQSRVVLMSDQCTLTITNLGSSLVAVECVGQGKPISKGTNSLPCVYAGTNANETGWFIHLRSLDAKN